MLSPEDILGPGTLSREDLPANIFYLFDRGLIELMIGYSPPMFDAARIAPGGIDIVEDPIEFDRQFPADSLENGHLQAEAMPLVMRLAEEADRAPLQGTQREWLLRDVRLLRDELRRSEKQFRLDSVRQALGWIPDYFEGTANEHLPTLESLRVLIVDRDGEDG